MEAVPVMRSFIVRAIAAGVLVSMISGCGANGAKEIHVDSHVFRVPIKHLLQGTIPWLPASQSDGLKFVINPGDRPEEQMIVTMESTGTTCHPKTPPLYNQLAIACQAAARKDDGSAAESNFILEKVHRNGDPTQWEYRLKGGDEAGQGMMVASCSALSEDGSSGLCTSLHNYKDLVYSVGLRDSDVQRLPAIWKQVQEMLASWEGSGNSEKQD